MKVKLELLPNKFIEVNRISYLFSLSIIGISLGILFMILLGGSIGIGLGIGFLYSIIFIVTDFFAWGGEVE